MEYLILAALFLAGWILSKLDTRARIRHIIASQSKEVVEQAFVAGANHGAAVVQQQMMSAMQAQQDHDGSSTPSGNAMGFAIPTNKGN